MIYDEMSLTFTPDPVNPGRFHLVAHAPIGQSFEQHNHTGVLKVLSAERTERREKAQEHRNEYMPTPNDIAWMTAYTRAKHFVEKLKASGNRPGRLKSGGACGSRASKVGDTSVRIGKTGKIPKRMKLILEEREGKGEVFELEGGVGSFGGWEGWWK